MVSRLRFEFPWRDGRGRVHGGNTPTHRVCTLPLFTLLTGYQYFLIYAYSQKKIIGYWIGLFLSHRSDYFRGGGVHWMVPVPVALTGWFIDGVRGWFGEA